MQFNSKNQHFFEGLRSLHKKQQNYPLEILENEDKPSFSDNHDLSDSKLPSDIVKDESVKPVVENSLNGDNPIVEELLSQSNSLEFYNLDEKKQKNNLEVMKMGIKGKAEDD